MTVFVQENYHECLCRRTIMTVFVQENYHDCVCAGELS